MQYSILHSEHVVKVVGAVAAATIAISPAPLCRFIKDHITADGDSTSEWIIGHVCLAVVLITDKDHLPSPVFQFLQIGYRVPHIDNATKHL
jgi:hypothetical protein